jgi:hypothetical protein
LTIAAPTSNTFGQSARQDGDFRFVFGGVIDGGPVCGTGAVPPEQAAQRDFVPKSCTGSGSWTHFPPRRAAALLFGEPGFDGLAPVSDEAAELDVRKVSVACVLADPALRH